MRKYTVIFARAWQQQPATNASAGTVQSYEQSNLRAEECGVTEMPLTVTTALMLEKSVILEVKL